MSTRPFAPSRPVAELLLVLGVPAAMIYMAISSAVHGNFAAPGCGPGRILALTLFGPDKQGLTCFRLPFTADLPSLGLGLTSETAVVLYLLLVRRLRNLDVVLAHAETGIFGPDQLTQEPMKSRYAAFVAKLRVSEPRQLLLLVGVVAVGIWFYVNASQNNHVFKALANVQGVAHPDAALQDGYRLSWWARWETDPAMAILWIIVGSIGTYFASRQAYLYFHLARLFREAPKLMVFHHVPARIDRDHGWRPVGRLVGYAYFSLLSFVCSLIVLIYIMRDPDAAVGYRVFVNVLLATVAVVGMVLNVAMVTTLRRGVAHVYETTLRDKIIALNSDSDDAEKAGDPLAARTIRLEAGYLVGDSGYPVRGRALRFASLISGLIPVVKLSHDVLNLYF
ncbi:hypothetical protein ABZ342_22240 [Amycolatopsis sp. NPDC005961]|uniref:hypothetical protein n=1 Tax=Amycolatopsis sp. NPDC005961 TaxID=3156720 RepID=UPI0033C46542